MQSERTLLTLRTLAIISAVAVVPIILLWVVDSQIGLALLAGLAVAWVIYFIVRWLRGHPNVTQALGLVLTPLIVLLLIVAGIGIVGVLGSPGVGGGGGGGELLDCPKQLIITDATLVIDGSGLSSGMLTIGGEVNGTKKITYNTFSPPSFCPPQGEVPLPTQDIPTQTLPVTERGFTLSETRFFISNVLLAAFKDYDVVTTFGAVVTIELRNFPRGSFYQARGVNTVETSTYLDTETVKWSPPEDDVTFSFIRPGYTFTRPVVDLMYGAQTFDKLAVGAAGSLGTLILGTVVDVVVGRFVKKPLEGLFEKKPPKKRKT